MEKEIIRIPAERVKILLGKDRKTKEPAIEESVFIRDSLLEEGLLYEKGGYYHNRMQFIPPINIGKVVIDRVSKLLDKVLGKAEKQFGIS